MSTDDSGVMVVRDAQHFPRWRVLWRAIMKAEDSQLTWSAYFVTALLGACVATAVALFHGPTITVQHVKIPLTPPAGDIFVSALIGFVGLPIVVFVGLMLWHLAAYRCTRRHKRWGIVGNLSSTSVYFGLKPRDGRLHWPAGGPDRLECRIQTPSGQVHHRTRDANAHFDGIAEAGEYRVRWYGADGDRRLTEITRARVAFEAPPSSGEPPRDGQVVYG
jgi:hypothetical protein